MVSLYAIVCYENVARSVPTNYIFMIIFTVSMSYICTGITLAIEPKIVAQAAIMTAVITISLTIFAFTTNWDATEFAPCVLLCVFFPAIILQFVLSFFLGSNSIWMVLFSCIFA